MLIAIETGACAGEVWRLTWNEFNPQNKSLTIIGVKGHRTLIYHVSDELCTLLMQIPRKAQRIFDNVVFAGHLNGRLNYYPRGTQVLVQQMSGGTSGAEICLCITGKKQYVKKQ